MESESDSESGPTFSFFHLWLQELRSLRHELRACLYTGNHTALPSLITRTLAHYESYYRTRSDLTRSDPVKAFTTPWASSLERSVAYWIAGWRPNTLIHLLHSESGRRFEAQLEDLLLGVHSGDLGDLSPVQVSQIDEIQRRTVEEEDQIGEEMGRIQEGEVDLGLVVGRIGWVMGRADELRMRTLRGVVGLLGSVQAAEFLIAAADLEYGFREYGRERERGRRRGVWV
ncbi:protein DOG1-like 3 [Typha latifolia]|uniref:protein DOG1-like 3 n=1 Tax=Typha latifolia TaxID=4733 RepID=UPI003C2DBB83